MGDAYTESDAIYPAAWATMDAKAILAQIGEYADRLRERISATDISPTLVLRREHLEMLVERASPATRVALAGMLCNPGGTRLVIAETEEQQRKAALMLAAEEEMRRDLIGTGIMQSIGRQSFDEAAMPRVGTAPLNRQQRRAAERAARKRK